MPEFATRPQLRRCGQGRDEDAGESASEGKAGLCSGGRELPRRQRMAELREAGLGGDAYA